MCDLHTRSLETETKSNAKNDYDMTAILPCPVQLVDIHPLWAEGPGYRAPTGGHLSVAEYCLRCLYCVCAA